MNKAKKEPENEIISEETLEKGEKETNETDLEALQKTIQELKSQSEDYLDSLQRERASFANYRKRIDQDNAQIYNNALADQIKVFLPVVDDLERALKNQPKTDSIRPWVDGINLILQKLLKAMENKGVNAIVVAPGEPFDPTFQEAVTHEENPDYSDGQVIETLQTGYKLNEKIIRPALVRVAK